MPQTSIRDQVKKLVELQKIDREIYSLKKDAKEKPEIIAALKQAFETTKAHLNKLEEDVKRIQLERKKFELDLKSQEENIAKANGQLSQLKTNKEYSAKLSEIESIKADKSIIEEKILLSYDEGDLVTSEITKEKVKVSEEEKKFLLEKTKIDQEIAAIEGRIKALESQRNQIVPEVDRNCLDRYERILKNKEGLAIVPVVKNICGGCNMNIPQQKINAIKMHDSFIDCEICARILYLEDDL